MVKIIADDDHRRRESTTPTARSVSRRVGSIAPYVVVVPRALTDPSSTSFTIARETRVTT